MESGTPHDGNPHQGTAHQGTPDQGTPHPPDDDSPARRPTKRKDPRWAKILLIVGAVIVIVSGVAFAGSQLLAAKVEDSVAQDNLLGEAGGAEPKTAADALAGPLNVLLIGLDARPGQSEAQSRADTIIVLHIPAAHDRAYLISVPRDLMVQVKPFKKSGYGGGRAKMTESFFHGAQGKAGVKGGTELLASTIKDTLGITFNAAAIINFDSFINVIEAFGGVDMCIDQTVTSIHLVMGTNGKPINIEDDPNGQSKGKPITYHQGDCRKFAAWEALDYSRQRYGLPNSDYDRQRHQQQLIKAIVKKATSAGVLTNPAKLNSVIKAAGAAFIIDTQGVPVTDFMFGLKNIGASGLITLRTNAGKVTSQNVDGISYEKLSPLSVSLFKAVQEDKIEAFTTAHPEFVSNSS
jgi:LCP family protein required for cell wall assembly